MSNWAEIQKDIQAGERAYREAREKMFNYIQGEGLHESDPNGLNPHEPGAKLDDGKVKAGVLMAFGRALNEVARVGTYGANKYSRHGWERTPDGFERYTDAMYRHLNNERYEPIDKETGLLTAAQVAWNALARLEFMLKEGSGND
ncbi:MAG: hypothetical protein JW724_03190 [Candidatus Altiarchaeota archaeon]|nr:hypothetical protein [Candidatus Altiarchaeota archaeon]